MLKANVGLSRKLSQDFNSTGFSVNLDGEITAALDDQEAILEQLRQLWDLAEEALGQQIERSQSIDALAHHDEEPPKKPAAAPTTNGHARRKEAEPATNKQIQYLLSIGKRQRLNTVQLEEKVAQILGQEIGLYDLSKREAGQVIDILTNNGSNGHQAASNGRSNGRSG